MAVLTKGQRYTAREARYGMHGYTGPLERDVKEIIGSSTKVITVKEGQLMLLPPTDELWEEIP
jgi:hypothetical protein